jgi:septum site-determining protein MinC
MSHSSSGFSSPCFEIKSAQWPLVALSLRSSVVEQLAHDMSQKFGEQVDFFDQDPLLIDLTGIEDQSAALDMASVLKVLKSFKLRPLAYKGGNAAQRMAAQGVGLVLADDASWHKVSQQVAAQTAPTPSVPAAPAPISAPPSLTHFLDKPLRSGQQFYARGGDLVVTAMVNPGAEVVADGSIHVYAPLRGKAIAGARGNSQARIFARELEAELISIAGVYRTSEVGLPDNVRGRAAHIRLQVSEQGERLLIEPL